MTMTKNIRSNVFETNSSSSHSITISAESKGVYDTLPVDEDGLVVLSGGEFGWEWEKYNDAETKANYAAVFSEGNPAWRQMLVDVIKKHTGAKGVEMSLGNCSYIDHQSGPGEGGDGMKAFESEENLKNFIFSPDSWLFTGNDNVYAPPNFYDVGEVKYTHLLDLDGVTEYLKSYPNDDELEEKLQALIYSHPLTQRKEYSWSGDESGEPYALGFGDRDECDSFAKMKEGSITLFKFKPVYGEDRKFTGNKKIAEVDIPFKITEL